MSETTEYAKVVKVLANVSTARGFQASLTLPNSKTLPHDDDFINFYVGVHGFECGISTAKRPAFYVDGEYKWHWFVNGPESASGSMDFSDGDSVTILLATDQSQSNKIVFKVNGVQEFISDTMGYGGTNNARLIVACLQATGVTLPLASWTVSHSTVTAAAMKYKDSSNNWLNITSSNTLYTNVYWPTNVSEQNIPTPRYYTASGSITNSTITASI